METKYLFICAFFLLFCLSIFIIVKYIPIIIVKRQAKNYKISLKNEEIQKLIKLGCVKSSFFEQVSFFVQENLNFNIIQLARHYISGGDLKNVLKGILYARTNKISIEYSDIYILDLAKLNIIEILKKGKPDSLIDIIIQNS